MIRKYDNFQKLEKIGEGTYGIVYKVRDIKTSKIYAIKKIRFNTETEGTPSTALREISILIEMNHINIVKLHDVIHTSDKLVLVFEYVDTDLKKYIDNIKKNQINENENLSLKLSQEIINTNSNTTNNNPITDQILIQKSCLPQLKIRSFLYQILRGINYIHKKKILHRDLKTQNILISNTGLLKIADFGLARGHSISIRSYTHEVITLWYRPPDILIGNKVYDYSIDIWSIGCVFAEMVLGHSLFCGSNESEQVKEILSLISLPGIDSYMEFRELPDYKEEYEEYANNDYLSYTQLRQVVDKNLLDDDGFDLLTKMLRINPKERITCIDALYHRYFEDLDDETIMIYS